jgi:solute carrier family 25 (mitochondrial oxoglutarate transporter), member 11
MQSEPKLVTPPPTISQSLVSLRDTLLPFFFASVSSCTATSVIQPIDTLKVRIQIAGESQGLSGGSSKSSISSIVKTILAEEGPKGFYKGLSSALLRQFTYGTIRIGTYRYLMENEQKKNKSVPFSKKFTYSLASGALGSLFGNPFDVVLVRFQADSTLAPELRRNYKGVSDAFARMYKEEGIRSFWKGYVISCLRAASMTSVLLSTNDEVKERINKFRNMKKADTLTNVVSAALSSIACSFCSLPFDNIKTKLQKMTADKHGVYPYSGIGDAFKKTYGREGVTGFWIGYSAFFMRVAPHSIIVLLLDEYLRRKFAPSGKY